MIESLIDRYHLFVNFQSGQLRLMNHMKTLMKLNKQGHKKLTGNDDDDDDAEDDFGDSDEEDGDFM